MVWQWGMQAKRNEAEVFYRVKHVTTVYITVILLVTYTDVRICLLLRPVDVVNRLFVAAVALPSVDAEGNVIEHRSWQNRRPNMVQDGVEGESIIYPSLPSRFTAGLVRLAYSRHPLVPYQISSQSQSRRNHLEVPDPKQHPEQVDR
jgi:hypothetical protein